MTGWGFPAGDELHATPDVVPVARLPRSEERSDAGRCGVYLDGSAIRFVVRPCASPSDDELLLARHHRMLRVAGVGRYTAGVSRRESCRDSAGDASSHAILSREMFSARLSRRLSSVLSREGEQQDGIACSCLKRVEDVQIYVCECTSITAGRSLCPLPPPRVPLARRDHSFFSGPRD